MRHKQGELDTCTLDSLASCAYSFGDHEGAISVRLLIGPLFGVDGCYDPDVARLTRHDWLKLRLRSTLRKTYELSKGPSIEWTPLAAYLKLAELSEEALVQHAPFRTASLACAQPHPNPFAHYLALLRLRRSSRLC